MLIILRQSLPCLILTPFTYYSLLLSIGTTHVKNAFLFCDLQKEVYVEQPPEFVAQRENIVCKLMKTIYELKRSPVLRNSPL